MEHNWSEYFDTESEYWKKVEKIYKESDYFPKVVVKNRNLHHKFPRSFSKKDGTPVDNDKDNLVSLSLADHFLVHYYLWKCCNKKGYRGMMARAFQFMRKKAVIYCTDETVEIIAKDYADAMKDLEVSQETKKKISEALKGKNLSEETRQKISEHSTHFWKGKTLSEETKKKMSDAKKGENHPMYGKIGAMKGKHHTEEARKKMSEARKGKYIGENSPMHGKHHSEETKKKLAEVMKGENHPMYGKHWKLENGKRVYY